MLSKILYYAVLWPLSYLPLSILYLLSDSISFILRKIVRYRRLTIQENLKNSYPLKSDQERVTILKNFYPHFTDIFVESIKGINSKRDRAKSEVEFGNTEMIEKLYHENKNIIIVLGHLGNWEKICINLPLFISHQVLGVYKPLKNKFYDRKVKEVRSKNGLILVEDQYIIKELNKKNVNPRAIVLIADQSPSNPKRAYWLNFLNQETSVQRGVGKLSQIYNMPVVYMHISKPKRGRYIVDFELLINDSKEYKSEEITNKHVNALEQNIRLYPHLWLWSHRRWKHKR